MRLNCKPGDLAVVVRITPGWSDECLGRIIRVKTLSWGSWTYEPQIMSKQHGRPFTHAEDDCLRPIRPGDLTQEEVDALYLPEVIKQRDPEAA